jgi:hypothetical protein
MARFGQSVFGTATFGESEPELVIQTNVVLQVSIEIEQRVIIGVDYNTSVNFALTGDISAEADRETDGGSATFGGTGGLQTDDPDVEPIGDTLEVASAVFAASGSLSVDAPTVVAAGITMTVEPLSFRGDLRIYAEPTRVRDQVGRILVHTPQSAPAGVLASLPNQSMFDAFTVSQIKVWRCVDILNSDESLWATEVGFTEGSITAEMGRDERRTLELTLDNFDRKFTPTPKGLWYDKLIRVRRGIEVDGQKIEFDIGHFMIDQFTKSESTLVGISGRDYAKRMMKDRIPAPVSFKKNTLIDEIIKALALNAGIRRTSFSGSGKRLREDATFDSDTSRWEIANKLAIDHGQDLFMNRAGSLQLKPQVDPLVEPAVLTIGVKARNAINFDRSTNDGELHNHVVVVSTVDDQDIPAWVELENNEPSSPTRIAKIGRRTKKIETALTKDRAQLLEIARNFLRVAALEQFEVTFSSLNYPWLDAGSVIEIDDPDAGPTDPTRFLLTSLTIPLRTGAMTGTAKRITIVGQEVKSSVSASKVTNENLVWGEAVLA